MSNCSNINNTTIKGTSAVSYDSTPLPCTDVNTCDGLNTIIDKFNNVLCTAKANVASLTEDITNLTEDVMIIIEDIIDINDRLDICCPPLNCTLVGNARFLNCELAGNGIIIPPTTTTTTTVAPTTTTTTTIAPTTTTTTTVLDCELAGNGIIIPPTTTTTTTTSGPVAITMILSGTDTQLEACADIATGPPLILITTRYAVNTLPITGDTIYNGPGLTNPTTFPLAVYYGFLAQPGGNLAWMYVDTNGVVISSGYCS